MVVDNGNTLIILAGNKPCIVTVVLSVALADKVDTTSVTITIGNVDPNPQPIPPNPQPDPQPDKPLDVYPLPTNATPAEVAIVKSVYSSMVQQVGAGAIKTPDELYYKTAEELLSRIGRNRIEVWIPWRDQIDLKGKALFKPKTLDDYKAMWSAIAAGIK